MSTATTEKPSFSRVRRWGMGLRVAVATVLALSVVIMLNYLGRDNFLRFRLSAAAKNPLSQRTAAFVSMVTNKVNVTIYYDKEEPLYSTVADLLAEYSLANPRIQVKTVDYLRDAGAALKLKDNYGFLATAAAKNLVIFDCGGKVKTVDGNALAQYALEQVPGESEREFIRKPVAFLGEIMFTAALLDVTNPRPLKACFLLGHGEHQLDSADENVGYLKFASVLQQNYIQVEKLSLLGTNVVPMDCNLLVIAGPTGPIPEQELQKIDEYLAQGGRLLAAFNFLTASKETGLEKVLAKWGVQVGSNLVKDPDNTLTSSDVVVDRFGKHPLVDPLTQLRLHLIMPRSVSRNSTTAADAPQVEEIMFSGPKSTLANAPGSEPRSYPLGVAVEKGAIKGVITERGTTRMVILGDSICLANRQIESAANRDFAGYIANWLLERRQLMQGVGPQPIAQYKLTMTEKQLRQTRLILLAGMPGSVLLVGIVVWLRRRR